MAGLFQSIFQSKAAAAHSVPKPSVASVNTDATQAQAEVTARPNRGLGSTNLSGLRKARDAYTNGKDTLGA